MAQFGERCVEWPAQLGIDRRLVKSLLDNECGIVRAVAHGPARHPPQHVALVPAALRAQRCLVCEGPAGEAAELDSYEPAGDAAEATLSASTSCSIPRPGTAVRRPAMRGSRRTSPSSNRRPAGSPEAVRFSDMLLTRELVRMNSTMSSSSAAGRPPAIAPTADRAPARVATVKSR